MRLASTPLQEALFSAIKEGDCAALHKAYEEGADPHALYDDLTVWEIAALDTPFPLLRPVLDLFRTWGVKHLHEDWPGSHPCLSLTAPYADTTQRSLHPPERPTGKAAWEIWGYMSPEERRRILLALDAQVWNKESDYDDKRGYHYRMLQVWRETSSIEIFYTSAFSAYRQAARMILATPSSVEEGFSEEEKACITEESVVWCLSGLYMDTFRKPHLPLDHGVGAVLLEAPEALLKRCLEKGPSRTLMMHFLEQAVQFFTQETSPAWDIQYPALEPSCLALTQRWHACGVNWPTEWPEPVREALFKVPAVRRFWEGFALTRVLENDGDVKPLSSLRARL